MTEVDAAAKTFFVAAVVSGRAQADETGHTTRPVGDGDAGDDDDEDENEGEDGGAAGDAGSHVRAIASRMNVVRYLREKRQAADYDYTTEVWHGSNGTLILPLFV
jgi:hypothetical protein